MSNVKGDKEIIAQLQAAIDYIEQDAPDVVGNEAVKFFKNNIAKGTDIAGEKFAPRKIPRTGSTNAQGTLIQSGDLIESIDYRVQGDTVVIYSDLPYAEIHNEGGELVVTPKMKKFFWAKYYEVKKSGLLDIAEMYKNCALAKTIVFPKRQFIGDSPELDKNIIDKITRDLDRIMKS